MVINDGILYGQMHLNPTVTDCGDQFHMTPSDTHLLVFSYCVVPYHMIPELACMTHRVGQKQCKWLWLLSWITSS